MKAMLAISGKLCKVRLYTTDLYTTDPYTTDRANQAIIKRLARGSAL